MIAQQKEPKIALVHDYLIDYGGAERVLEALHELYPEAPVYVAFIDKDKMGVHWRKFADWDIRETWLAKLPLIKKLYSPLRVLADKAFSSLDLADYDVVISSSNAFMAKAVRATNGVHICYCHTPPRALYGYSTMTNWKSNPIVRVAGTLLNHYMRVIDYKIAQQVDYFIANSTETERRIHKFYRRNSVVIHPPVNVPLKLPIATKREYYLYVNRLALAKHPELAVQAANQLNLPLKVVGSGAMKEYLKEIAGPTVEFLGAVKDAELNELYSGAKALLYPVEDEDFGIVPIEAMGHGVPVISHRSGGPMETIIEGKTGVFFDELNVTGLVEAIEKAQKKNWQSELLYEHAQQYSTTTFQKKISSFVSELLYR
jgi:glycosyltransferase involved in cell wall biosynthesis